MEHSKRTINSTRQFWDALIGNTCWAAIAGSGTGSKIMFNFGEKIPRKKPVPNLKISHDAQNFDGEFVVFVQSGARWQLENNCSLICSHMDSNEAGGVMLSGLALLIGKSVSSVEYNQDFSDVALNFDDGLCFRMSPRSEKMDVYWLSYMDESIEK